MSNKLSANTNFTIILYSEGGKWWFTGNNFTIHVVHEKLFLSFMVARSYQLFWGINVTEKNFCHMGNRTHNFGTNRLAFFAIHGS